MNIQLKKIVASIMLVVILLLCFVLVGTVRQLKNHGYLSWRYYVGNHSHRLVTTADILYIAPWMTFDYVNKIFNLPQSYLEQNLQIHDSKYPRITIQKYSKSSGTNPVILIQNIRNYVKQYFASSTPQ